MSNRKRRSRGHERAIRSQRDALQAAKKAVDAWCAAANGNRDATAASMLRLLSECAKDTDGDKTLDLVNDLFEEHIEVLGASEAHEVMYALGLLVEAARTLGQNVSPHLR